MFQAADTIGTIHYSRFTILSERTLLLLSDFDGDFGPLMTELAKLAGPVFDAVRICRWSSPHTGGRTIRRRSWNGRWSICSIR